MIHHFRRGADNERGETVLEIVERKQSDGGMAVLR